MRLPHHLLLHLLLLLLLLRVVLASLLPWWFAKQGVAVADVRPSCTTLAEPSSCCCSCLARRLERPIQL
jgi:hypothetical protein